MIVLSNALVLSAEQVYDADNPVIGWDNLVTVANISAGNAAAGYPVTNLANPNTSLEWRANNTTDQYLTILVDRVDPIDYIAVARHNWGSGLVVNSAEGRASAVDAFSELVQENILADDSPALFRFPLQSLYEIRFKLQPGAVAPRAAVVYCGKLLVMERGIWVGHTPLVDAIEQDVASPRAESGDFIGRIVLGEWTESPAKFQLLSPAWYRANMRPFLSAARTNPFFFGWRPATYPRESGFAVLTNNPKPVPTDPSHLLEIELQMRGIP